MISNSLGASKEAANIKFGSGYLWYKNMGYCDWQQLLIQYIAKRFCFVDILKIINFHVV